LKIDQYFGNSLGMTYLPP